MSDWLIERFTELKDRGFLAEPNSPIATYRQLGEKVQAFESQFAKAGVKAGEVVTLLGDYSLDGIAALLALFQLKAISAPITAASADEIKTRQSESRANWQITCSEKLEITRLHPESEPHPFIIKLTQKKRAGLILFSSGSTGRPKAMIHDADQLLSPFKKKRKRKLHILIFLLFDHIGGLNTLFNGLASGALLVVPKTRDALEVGKLIAEHKVNLLPASPTFLNLLLMSEAHIRCDLSSLRFITYGTEPMPESLLHRIKEALPNVALIQTFGTSETGISQTVSRASDSTLIKFDDPNTEFKIVEGELWLRSQNQVLGYLNHAMDRFTNDGWFRTGDLVEEADDGFMKIVGRREDVINVGGEKVTPSEVESVLLEIPEVMDCIVFSEENSITGQNVAAQIVPSTSHDTQKLKRKIKNYCRAKLTAFKVPARITFADQTIFSKRFKKMRLNKN